MRKFVFARNNAPNAKRRGEWLPAEIEDDLIQLFGWTSRCALPLALMGGIELGRDIPVAQTAACCPSWEKAQQSGTDNEMHGSLVRPDGNEWRIGYDLPSVAFCPFCGAKKFPGV